jgi:hypothetical protein
LDEVKAVYLLAHSFWQVPEVRHREAPVLSWLGVEVDRVDKDGVEVVEGSSKM